MDLSRREFLGSAAGAAAVSGAVRPVGAQVRPRLMGRRPVVVVARNEKMLQGDDVDRAEVERTLAAAMRTLTGSDAESDAWRRFFGPDDAVGIKVNCLAAPGFATHPEVAYAAAKGCLQAGVRPDRVVIWDRQQGELHKAGYELNPFFRRGVRCVGTDHPRIGYEDEITLVGRVGSCVSRIQSQQCTALLNAPLLKDHGIVGVTCSMKNMLGAIHNPNKLHDGCGDPYVADLNCFPEIKNKLRLIVCDALNVQVEGGPSFHPQWVRPYRSIVVGNDPVALDKFAATLIDKMRDDEGLRSLEKADRRPTYIDTAGDEEHDLGERDPAKIEVRQVGADGNVRSALLTEHAVG